MAILRDMSISGPSFTLSQDVRSFPRTGPLLENETNVSKGQITIYADTPKNEKRVQHKTNHNRIGC